MRCSSPRCPTERAEGSRFCERHRDLFAKAAAEIEEGKTHRIRSPTRTPRRVVKVCDTPGCPEPVEPRESYCAAHLEELSRRAAQA